MWFHFALVGDDVYMFESFYTSSKTEARRPTCATLYDTFRNIRDDEAEHMKTMVACKYDQMSVQLDAKYGNTGRELSDE